MSEPHGSGFLLKSGLAWFPAETSSSSYGSVIRLGLLSTLLSDSLLLAHSLLQQRSYLRLRAAGLLPEEDFHLSDDVRSMAHSWSCRWNSNRVSLGRDAREEYDENHRCFRANVDTAGADATTPPDHAQPPVAPVGTTAGTTRPAVQRVVGGLRGALELALDEARAAGLWAIVATLATQLDGLPAENVMSIDGARTRRR